MDGQNDPLDDPEEGGGAGGDECSAHYLDANLGVKEKSPKSLQKAAFKILQPREKGINESHDLTSLLCTRWTVQ